MSSDGVTVEYRVMPGSGEWIPYTDMVRLVAVWAGRTPMAGTPALTVSKRVTVSGPECTCTDLPDSGPERDCPQHGLLCVDPRCPSEHTHMGPCPGPHRKDQTAKPCTEHAGTCRIKTWETRPVD